MVVMQVLPLVSALPLAELDLWLSVQFWPGNEDK